MALPQLERDSDFDDHVDRDAVPAGRREAPLAHRFDRALIQSAVEAALDAHVADRAIAPDDDLEHDVSLDPLPSRLVGVERLDLALKTGRIDAGARPIRTAAFAAAAARADARPVAFTDAGAAAGARAAARA